MQYEIKGGSFPVVECQLAAGEKMVTESGSMVWMSSNMKMETKGGGLGGMFSKALAGEKLFQNIYSPQGSAGSITFGSSFPGKIIAIELAPGKDWILQKKSFLACEEGVKLDTFFNKKFSSGVFGGEGFIMQRLSGSGIAFAEIDGELVEYELKAGEKLIVDTGYVAGCDASVSITVEQVSGLKNVMFGGEGLFNTVLTGPGRVWLQTMPLSGVAAALAPFISNNG